MANIKFHQVRQLLKLSKHLSGGRENVVGLEISKKDYTCLARLPQYFFWEDFLITHTMLMNGINSSDLRTFRSPNEYFYGLPASFDNKETRVIFKNGRKVRMNIIALFFGWLECTLDPKIIW